MGRWARSAGGDRGLASPVGEVGPGGGVELRVDSELGVLIGSQGDWLFFAPLYTVSGRN